MTQKIVSVTDGPRISVNTLIKNPTVIPRRVLAILQNQFLADTVLRKLPPNDGALVYQESTPLFADGDAAVVNEFGEIPVVSGRVGDRKVAVSVKRALAIRVSEEMRRRNDMDAVQTQITQVKNTMVRTWDTSFLTTLMNHPDVNSLNATVAWDQTTSKIRKDLTDAMAKIENAALAGHPDNFFGFVPDTLVIGVNARNALINSDDFAKAYSDKLVDKAPAYTGALPGTFFGLTILVSRDIDRIASGKALLLQRGVVGGISDERPMNASPLYHQPEVESWRSNIVRQSAIVLDQPKAACWINGVVTP